MKKKKMQMDDLHKSRRGWVGRGLSWRESDRKMCKAGRERWMGKCKLNSITATYIPYK